MNLLMIITVLCKLKIENDAAMTSPAFTACPLPMILCNCMLRFLGDHILINLCESIVPIQDIQPTVSQTGISM